MFKLVSLALTITVIRAAPGIFGELDLGSYHEAPLDAAPIFPASVLAPAVLKTPIIAHAPAPAVFAPAPIIKTVAPIIKHVAPATSYATVTQFHVTHPATVIKAVVAPQPVLKTLALPVPFSFDHGDGYH